MPCCLPTVRLERPARRVPFQILKRKRSNADQQPRIMGACYNTILIPQIPREDTLSALAFALDLLGHRIIHCEERLSAVDEFKYQSTRSIFIGPQGTSPWVPIVTWGEGLSFQFPDGYRKAPLALTLSRSVGPIIYYFSHNAGQVAGYSIFSDDRQVEAQTVTWQSGLLLGEFAPPMAAPNPPSLLAHLLGDLNFEYEYFMRSFSSLEIGTAALAARLGAHVHLTDALDIQDGDGAIIVENGEYRSVVLSDWMAVYYERCVV